LKKYCQTYFFQVGADGFLMAAILYPRLQWVMQTGWIQASCCETRRLA